MKKAIPGSTPDLTPGDLSDLLATAPLFAAIHAPVFADDGSVVDFQLIWWNDFYARVRRDEPVHGQSMLGTYVDPHVALDIATRAWHGEEVPQEFAFEFDDEIVYSWSATETVLSVRWFRFRDFVAEVAQDVTELKSAENRLLESELELLESWRRQEIIDVKQEIARDMHDSVIQRLLAVGMGVRHTLKGGDISEQNRVRAELVIRNLDQAIHELRSIVDTLTAPTPFERTRGHLEEEVVEVIESMTPLLGHHPAYSFNNLCNLSDDVKYDVAAVVRESLANVAKHASASRSFVHIECQGGSFTVRVLDDGVGPGEIRPGGHGLVNLTERATRRGGSLDLSARLDRPGSRLKWSIPCPKATTEQRRST